MVGLVEGASYIILIEHWVAREIMELKKSNHGKENESLWERKVG